MRLHRRWSSKASEAWWQGWIDRQGKAACPPEQRTTESPEILKRPWLLPNPTACPRAYTRSRPPQILLENFLVHEKFEIQASPGPVLLACRPIPSAMWSAVRDQPEFYHRRQWQCASLVGVVTGFLRTDDAVRRRQERDHDGDHRCARRASEENVLSRPTVATGRPNLYSFADVWFWRRTLARMHARTHARTHAHTAIS
jgi:hypothetical protein